MQGGGCKCITCSKYLLSKEVGVRGVRTANMYHIMCDLFSLNVTLSKKTRPPPWTIGPRNTYKPPCAPKDRTHLVPTRTWALDHMRVWGLFASRGGGVFGLTLCVLPDCRQNLAPSGFVLAVWWPDRLDRERGLHRRRVVKRCIGSVFSFCWQSGFKMAQVTITFLCAFAFDCWRCCTALSIQWESSWWAAIFFFARLKLMHLFLRRVYNLFHRHQASAAELYHGGVFFWPTRP